MSILDVPADDNVVQSFQLETSNLRGRMIRLGGVLDDILGPHDYPKHVAHLVGEAITLSGLLSSMLKYDGIFTVQTKGDGPVNMIVADMTTKGEIRGCASYDEERLEQAIKQLAAMKTGEDAQNHLAQLLGKGHIAFTVDQKGSDRYQGIVELKGSSLIDCVQHYFGQSEQINTGIKMAVGQRDGRWRAGAVMLQNLPEEGGKATGNLDEDDWRRAMILMDSCTEDELLAPELHSNEILLRLFHEEGVRVYEPHDIQKGCRCSEEKVENMLTMMDQDDRDYMAIDGKIEMKCEFCSRDFHFDAKDIERKIKDQVSQRS